jgi:hypothetical protein
MRTSRLSIEKLAPVAAPRRLPGAPCKRAEPSGTCSAPSEQRIGRAAASQAFAAFADKLMAKMPARKVPPASDALAAWRSDFAELAATKNRRGHNPRNRVAAKVGA